jgi:adenylylsulfate kinase-like enzyme
MIFKLKLKNSRGLWLYGLSGSGKSFFSKILNKQIKDSIIIDGDNVRKIISSDLGYSQKDREIQINRIFGISKLIIESKKFPIISTVYMNKKINNLCKKNKISCLMVLRENFNDIKKNHKTYKNKSNVVGKDIFYERFKKSLLINNNTSITFKII